MNIIPCEEIITTSVAHDDNCLFLLFLQIPQDSEIIEKSACLHEPLFMAGGITFPYPFHYVSIIYS